jgi:hypothetical protein
MRLDWNGLLRRQQTPEDSSEVALDGKVVPLEDAPPDRLLLVQDADCCATCLPGPETTVECGSMLQRR